MIEKLPEFDPTEASIYHCETFVGKINEIIDWINNQNHEYKSIFDVVKEWEKKNEKH